MIIEIFRKSSESYNINYGQKYLRSLMSAQQAVFFFFNFYFQLQGTYLQYLLTNHVQYLRF